MRDAFAKSVTALAAIDSRIVLLSGDIGNRMFDNFKAQFPGRFYNCGVAEAGMVGLSAGLAKCGYRPILYTIAPFLTARCFEQVRLDLCYQKLPVILAGTGAGLSYASLGATHHSTEDIAILRSIPGMTVVCPGDAVEVRLGLSRLVEQDGPAYLRLGKKGEPVIHREDPPLQIGKALVLKSGADVCLLSTGNVLPEVVEAATRLAVQGVDAQVVSFHTVKPLDRPFLADVFARFELVVTIEEHSRVGGLGGAISEWLADREVGADAAGGRRARLLRIALPDEFAHGLGEQEEARELFGLSAERIAGRVAEVRNRLIPPQRRIKPWPPAVATTFVDPTLGVQSPSITGGSGSLPAMPWEAAA